MKHTKWISLLLCLAMLLTLLPQLALFGAAEDGYADIPNFKVSSGGLVSWTPVPNAKHYFVEGGMFWDYFWLEENETGFDFAQVLADNYAPSGGFIVNVYAYDEDYNTIAKSHGVFTYTGGLPHLDIPQNHRWEDGYVATWDPVAGADNGYTVTLYDVTGTTYSLGSYTTNETSFDLSYFCVDSNTQYAFSVFANGCPNGARSDETVLSAAKSGRFVYGAINLGYHYYYGEGGFLLWDNYVDNEGNPAASYYLSQNGSNPAYLPGECFTENKVPIERLLYLIDAPSGDYTFAVWAENEEGLRVSDYSNSYTYTYTADTTSPSVRMQGYDSHNGWPKHVLVDSMEVYNYTKLRCKTANRLPVTYIPDEHHKLGGLRFFYGGEYHDDPERIKTYTERPDGSVYMEIQVPEEDFKLVFDQEVIYDLLYTAEIDLNTAIGARIPGYYENIADPSLPYEVYVRRVETDGFGSTDWILPEVNYHFVLVFRAKYWGDWYKHWAPEAGAKVNGQLLSVTDWDDEDTEITVQYDYAAPEASSVTLERAPWDEWNIHLNISADGVATWDEVAGTEHYRVWCGEYEHNDLQPYVRSFDVKEKLASVSAPSGWYIIEVAAEQEDYTWLDGECVAYHYTDGAERIATPQNPVWEGYTATWDEVPDTNYYNVYLYRGSDLGSGSYSYYANEPFYDFSSAVIDAGENYMFRVQAVGNETLASSLLSEFSAPIPGRFYKGPIELSLSGDALSWPAYVDTEGKQAYDYEIYVVDEHGDYRYFIVSSNLVNLRQYMEMLDLPDGSYTVQVTARNAEGIYVSERSNEVLYSYVADSSRTTVTMADWRYADGSYQGVDTVYANGMEYGWYHDEYTMNVGETVKLTFTSREDYRVTGVKLYYDETEHDLGAPTLGADGKYTFSFKVPDKDFHVRFVTKWILKDIPAVTGSFDETTGQMLSYKPLTVSEDAHYEILINGISGPHGVGNAYMRPGAEYTVNLGIYADYGYQFPDSLTVTINGSSVSVKEFASEHTVAYADYTFRSTAEVSSILVQGVSLPMAEELPKTSNLFTNSYDPYKLDMEHTAWYRVQADDSWIAMESDEAFRAGERYVLQLAYDIGDSCTWAPPVEAVIEDETVEAAVDHIFVGEGSSLPNKPKIVEIHFKPLEGGSKVIREAYCTITEPVGFRHPDLNPQVDPDAPYTVGFDYWYLGFEPYPHLEAEDVFHNGWPYHVRIRFIPKEGYHFNESTVFYINGKTGSGSFGGLGARDMTFDAKYGTPFVDVSESDYFFEPVAWAVTENITNGMDDTHFGPGNKCTRGQVVTFLWRAKGSPEPTATTTPFTDVRSDQYYYKPVLWAVEKKITSGMTPTTFGPNRNCTRGQVVTFLWRTLEEPEPETSSNPFTDVGEKAYYYKAVLWAVERGITNGISATKFGPDSTCTRGQIVTFLYRTFAGKG